MRITNLLLVALVGCGGGSGAGGGGGSTTPVGVGTIALTNHSHYDIYSIQLSPYDHLDWGQNLIGGDALLHGETAQVAVFECKKYDLRLVDHENDECVIQDIDLCLEDKAWTVDDTVLAVCAAVTGWQ